MRVSDRQLLEFNPWWKDPDAIERDPKLRALATRSFRWDPPALDAVELAPGRTHTLRGPRQVGKSTTAKQLVRRLLQRGERRVLYFSFDLSRQAGDIADVVRRARALHPDPEGPWYLFFDEVTAIPDWQLGVKFIADDGPSDGDCILCTGSSARKVGSEQLQGRRGAGRHYLQLPVSFRDFCLHALGMDLPEPTVSPGEMLGPEGARILRAMHLSAAPLERAWRAYAAVGGYPAAIEDFLTVGDPTDGTVDMLWDSVAGDVRDLGRDAVATLKLLARVNRSLGAPLSWHALAEDMDVAEPTAREYVRILAESFMLLTVYFWDPRGRGLNPKKRRKIFLMDPLLARIPGRRVPGAATPSESAVRENLVAAGLFRSCTDRLVQAEAVAGSVGFWISGRGTEVDFVVAEPALEASGGRLPIEVEGNGRAAIANARKSLRAAFGSGIVVTSSVLDLDNPIPAIPAPVFLAALPERVERRPITL